MARLALAWCLCRVLIGESAGAAGVRSYAADCDTTPTGIETHRVGPVYAVRCQDIPSRAAVLIHGPVVSGPVAFDLRYPPAGQAERAGSVGVGGNRHVHTEPAAL
jgi:hypothetical protein